MKKNPDYDHTPHWGARENFNEKRQKAMRKHKKRGIIAQETQMLGGMPKSLEK